MSTEYLMGIEAWRLKGLYGQVVWAAQQLSIGYYGWREGSLTRLHFKDGSSVRLAPTLNAGTVALMYMLTQFHDDQEAWNQALDPESGFPALYQGMFGDSWERAGEVEPLFEADLTQPELTLPFLPGHTWAFTGGPHSPWEDQAVRAALDFTPSSLEVTCEASYEWVVAPAAGLVVRSEHGVVVQDLDGDGDENTGWVLLYVHIDRVGRVDAGTWLEAGDLVGHPSCEGGPATGAHLHIARKYNGEWMAAGGPVPFNLGGWVAAASPEDYSGTLTRNGETVTSCACATSDTYIKRPRDEQ
jgi:hypothetical protein